MRILWLSHLVPYPPKGGMLQRAYHLVRGLAARHEVKLLCFNQRALLPTAADVRQAVEALAPLVEIMDVVDIPSNHQVLGRERLAIGSYLSGESYSVRWLRSNRYRAMVSKAVRDFAPDLVHFDTISLAQYREEVGPRPSVLNHHNIESAMMARRAEVESQFLKRHYYATEARRLRRYESDYSGRFDLHLTCSDLDADRLQQVSPEVSTEVVPNGVDLDYFTPSENNSSEVPQSLIFAGGLNWYPNVSAVRFLVHEVWPLVQAAYPAATLTIVGRSPPKWLQACAEADRRIRVPGFVDDVRPYMERACVYVCPIFDGGGTKLKVLDAMAMGKPLVANPIAVEGIDADPEHHWLSAESAEEFASAIGRCFADAGLRARLGGNARELIVQRYSFAQIGQRLSNRYETLLQQHRKSTRGAPQ